MTSNEILKAEVLDILFENRNKHYGAYALRKQYNHRLGMALGIALTVIVFACLLLLGIDRRKEISKTLFEKPPVELTPVDLTPPPAEPPRPATPPASAPVATIQHTLTIQIVPELDPQDAVPEIGELVAPQIGTVTQEGGLPTENRTMQESQAQAANVGKEEAAGRNFEVVERQPEFPGGQLAWSNFLSRHLRVPDELEAGERKTVAVKFWVAEDGSITRFEVVQSAGALFDNEVIRVLRKMPKWKPAIQNGQAVAVTFTQPVTFQAFEE